MKNEQHSNFKFNQTSPDEIQTRERSANFETIKHVSTKNYVFQSNIKLERKQCTKVNKTCLPGHRLKLFVVLKRGCLLQNILLSRHLE